MGQPFCPSRWVKMAKYHHFIEFLAKNTVLELNGDLPLFIVLEFTKLEFPIFYSIVAR